jgi:hypothetical protein
VFHGWERRLGGYAILTEDFLWRHTLG